MTGFNPVGQGSNSWRRAFERTFFRQTGSSSNRKTPASQAGDPGAIPGGSTLQRSEVGGQRSEIGDGWNSILSTSDLRSLTSGSCVGWAMASPTACKAAAFRMCRFNSCPAHCNGPFVQRQDARPSFSRRGFDPRTGHSESEGNRTGSGTWLLTSCPGNGVGEGSIPPPSARC